MEFPVKTGAPASQRTECAILPLFDDGLRGATKELDTAARGLIKQLVRNGDASARLGATALIHRTQGTAATRWLLVGCGKAGDFNAKRFATAVGAAINALRATGTKEALSYLGYAAAPEVVPYQAARQTVEMTRATLYRFDELKSRTDAASKLARVGVAFPRGTDLADVRRGIKVGLAIANG